MGRYGVTSHTMGPLNPPRTSDYIVNSPTKYITSTTRFCMSGAPRQSPTREMDFGTQSPTLISSNAESVNAEHMPPIEQSRLHCSKATNFVAYSSCFRKQCLRIICMGLVSHGTIPTRIRASSSAEGLEGVAHDGVLVSHLSDTNVRFRMEAE